MKVVILSKDGNNLVPCVTSIMEREPALPLENIVVVDDGVEVTHKEKLPGITWVQGEKPFVFARNANIGIRTANDDVILMNDDTLLKSEKGLTKLLIEAEKDQDLGVVSAAVNSAGNPNQWSKGMEGIRGEGRMVCFVCVLIPKRTQEIVGLLDERFIHYGFDDDDYCLRVRLSNLKIGVFDGCYIDHLTLNSSYRKDGHRPLEPNKEIFEAKWQGLR